MAFDNRASTTQTAEDDGRVRVGVGGAARAGYHGHSPRWQASLNGQQGSPLVRDSPRTIPRQHAGVIHLASQ